MESVAQPVDLRSLTVEQLKELKRRWYAEAHRDGTLAACQDVVLELGTEHRKKHGANWVWEQDGIKIVLDDWTGALYVHHGDALVVVSTSTDRVFVPGPWLDGVRAASVEANARIAARRRAAADTERQALLRELGGA